MVFSNEYTNKLKMHFCHILMDVCSFSRKNPLIYHGTASTFARECGSFPGLCCSALPLRHALYDAAALQLRGMGEHMQLIATRPLPASSTAGSAARGWLLAG